MSKDGISRSVEGSVGSVEAGDERQIAVADDWQLQRLARSSSTGTAAPCPGDSGGPSVKLVQDPLRDVQPVQLNMQ